MAVITLGALASFLVGTITTFGKGLDVLFRNPIIAWFTLLVALSVDSFVIAGFTGNGLVGYILTWVISNFAGVTITVQSWNILFLIGISPVVIYAVKHSVSP